MAVKSVGNGKNKREQTIVVESAVEHAALTRAGNGRENTIPGGSRLAFYYYTFQSPSETSGRPHLPLEGESRTRIANVTFDKTRKRRILNEPEVKH